MDRTLRFRYRTAPALRGGASHRTAPALRGGASLLFGALCALAAACGADGRFVMLGSARAPSTSGIVEVDDLGGTSAQVAVHLEFLHPPNRLAPDLKSYVAWF